MTKNILAFLLLILQSSLLFSQEKLSENQKLETLCKVWGFLKYYHPNVAKGTYDWDNQLIEKIKESEKLDIKKNFDKMISEWIDSLGKVERCEKCNEKNDKVYFLKNFDLSWTDDRNIFSKEVIEKLNYIEENRNIDSDFYYSTKKDSGGFFGVKNEKQYADKYSDKEIRLLELFRYWNIIEYFFPYKYQTDKNWNEVLKEMIPEFISIKNKKEYLFTLSKMVSKINDTHAFFMATNRNVYYGNSQIPVETKFLENQLLVTEFYSTKNPYSQVLQKFDIIKKIDGKTPEEIHNYFAKYIPASNRWTLIRKISDLYLYSFKDKIKLEIIRDNQALEIEIETLKFADINYPDVIKPTEKWKFIDYNQKIGYINIGAIKVEDVKEIFQNLQNTDAIIFDVRHYPNLTLREISKYLLPKTTTYYNWIKADTQYPGKFYEEKAEIGQNNPNYYKGKVIALVNEKTQSQAETLTMMLKQHPNATIIGSPTAGANGNVVRLEINGIKTMYSGLGAFYPDGRETQRIGILPDVEIKPTIKGTIENRDEVLERALEYIKSGK